MKEKIKKREGFPSPIVKVGRLLLDTSLVVSLSKYFYTVRRKLLGILISKSTPPF